jgi:flagellar biosynthesis protein
MTESRENGPDLSHKAVALRYNREKENAPRIIAKGGGLIADKIIETAREHGIEVYEDKLLIELLSRIELYQVIPTELYQVIAEVLAFVYRLDRKAL